MKRVSLATYVALIVWTSLPLVAADDDAVPRTASGRPDLSGNYDIANLTPFERDPKYGDKLVMSREEAAAIEEQAAAAMAAANRESSPERDAPPRGGDGSAGAAGAVGGYNAFWVDPGTRAYAIAGKFRTSILTDPKDGRLPPLSEAGAELRSAANPYVKENTGDAWWLRTGDDPYDGPESLSLADRCLYVSSATVAMRPVLYNNLKTIVQTDDTVMILSEWMHWARVVRLDSEHLPSDVRSLAGDSIGWWQGDTLVVDTTNFRRIDSGLGERPWPDPSGRELHVVERFTPQGTDGLVYRFTVDDPDYSAPYSGELFFPRTRDRLYEYACHEGNYAMGNILRGARLLEREWIEKHGEPGAERAATKEK